MNRYDWIMVGAIAAYLLFLLAIASGPSGGFVSLLGHPSTAAWVQAGGGIGAIVAALIIGRNQTRHAEALRLQERLDRQRQSCRTALNAAIGIQGAVEIVHMQLRRELLNAAQCRALRNDLAGNMGTLRAVPAGDYPTPDAGGYVMALLQLAAQLTVRLEEFDARLGAGGLISPDEIIPLSATAAGLMRELEPRLISIEHEKVDPTTVSRP